MKEVHTEGNCEAILGDQIPTFGSVCEWGVMVQHLNQFTRGIKNADRALRWKIYEVNATLAPTGSVERADAPKRRLPRRDQVRRKYQRGRRQPFSLS